MDRRGWRRVAGCTLVAAAVVVPAVATAERAAPGDGTYTPGARSLGDPILPQLGNGGYDVEHYTIELDYDPVANRFREATTTIVATATQNLSELSFDFQSELDVRRVNINGRYVRFHFDATTPPLAGGGTQPTKLVVEPTRSARPRAGQEFTVVVTYRGTPQEIIDPDESSEGWIPACYPLNPPRTCDGAFVVNEPMGAQGWFPNNNHPLDKATFDTIITVPATKTALGIGELVSRTVNRNRTVTWHWSEDDPSATYLTTATVGDFTYTQGSMVETSTGVTLPIYNAVDSAATPTQLAAINGVLAQAPGQLNFLSDLYGPYPFDSTGAVADKASGVGYALEVQTKPHYAGGFTSGNPSINISTQLHEISHQWWGNAVTLETWADIWFNEGWANWSDWYWSFLEDGGDDPVLIFDDLYATTDDEDWALAPAVLDGDPANLFVFFPTYQRGAMTVQGYREIVGDETFFAVARTILDQYAYGNISTAEFIDVAVQGSGLSGADLTLLREYFQQWLYGTTRPTIVPESFGP